jgi:dolichyl-phosphate-mannose--protein O-mannosyl transferase
LEYHKRIGSGSNLHRYCSTWYTWLLMIRPVAYFYQTAQSAIEPLPVMGPPLLAADGKVIYDVHAIGNPVLWWLSTAAILFLLWMLVQRAASWGIGNRQERSIRSPLPADTWIVLYLVLNWLANLLPWVRVTRCTFMYHYMGASVFAGLAIAFVVDQCLHSYRRQYRALGVTIIFLILVAFVFWMPIYLGLPLSPQSYRLRMWLPSWI